MDYLQYQLLRYVYLLRVIVIEVELLGSIDSELLSNSPLCLTVIPSVWINNVPV